jgi:hypothetical protein
VLPTLPRIRLSRIPENSVKAKFVCEAQSPFQKAQERQRGSKKSGRPGKREKEEREDRPNAVTLITLRLPREPRICQVTIIIYTRWPFLNRPQLPSGRPRTACGVVG